MAKPVITKHEQRRINKLNKELWAIACKEGFNTLAYDEAADRLDNYVKKLERKYLGKAKIRPTEIVT